MKKDTYTFIAGLLDFLIVLVIAAGFALLFDILYHPFGLKPQEPVSIEDNRQLNTTEQYHRSQGRDILFVEDIFNY